MADATQHEIFADGILEIGFNNGTVRVDLYSYSVTDREEDGTPKKEFRQRIVLPPQGFLESFGTMQEMFRRLEDAGVIRRREAAAGDAEAAAKA